MTALGPLQELFVRFQELGWQGRIVSVERLPDLEEGLDGLRRQGLLDERFDQKELSSFVFRLPDSLPHARSVVVVAVPQPQTRALFTWQGQPRPLLIPPTYTYWRQTRERVQQLLTEVLGPVGCHVAPASLPLKLLTVRSGLGSYGRNNICYVPGLGSFHRLVAFYSDFPCLDNDWREVQMMEACQNCPACARACPTGAVGSERFLLHAERCLTFFNEWPGDFPSWLNPAWHNCLVGCMRCQRVCPENRHVRDWIGQTEEFSAEETSLLLAAIPFDQFPSATVEKLDRLGMAEYSEVLSRNLAVLLSPASG